MHTRTTDRSHRSATGRPSVDIGRILLATFGSAGDLFPLIPIVLALEQLGYDTRCAAPRGLGLYLRTLGLRAYALGSGAELSVVSDPDILSSKFDGWNSWRLTTERYVAPTATKDAQTLGQVFADWRPDLVIASGFAAAARVTARREGVPVLDLSIYPQHDVLAGRGPAFARSLAHELRSNSAKDLWGAPADAFLHDRELAPAHVASRCVGFPYWDGIPGSQSDASSVERHFSEYGPPCVATFGSFIGLAKHSDWWEIAEATRSLRLPAIFVGAQGAWARREFARRPEILCVGYVPLSTLFPKAAVAVHHGGLGTTFAALRAGCPAVVVPQAFDQMHNARLVKAAGIGVGAARGDVRRALVEATEPDLRHRTQHLAARLTPTDVAVRKLLRTIESMLDR